jgi:hypothetical protein
MEIIGIYMKNASASNRCIYRSRWNMTSVKEPDQPMGETTAIMMLENS